MNQARLTPWLIGLVLVLLIAGVVGWSIGDKAAKGSNDAHQARQAGFEAGYEQVFAATLELVAKRGLQAGASRGLIAGKKTGSREGGRIGAGNAEIEQAVASQKAANSAASAAESEIAARQANCGVVAAAPGWCPTSDEISSYRAAVQAARQAKEDEEKKKEEKRQEAADAGR